MSLGAKGGRFTGRKPTKTAVVTPENRDTAGRSRAKIKEKAKKRNKRKRKGSKDI